MSSGIGYDSAQGRAICGAITAIMTGVAYSTSAEMASELGPFPGYRPNAQDMLRVIRNHRRAAHGEAGGYEKLSTNPVPLDHASCADKRLVAGGEAGVGSGAGTRRAARLSQRTGDGRCADRHDRSGDGLRYDRHRARLRDGEVQEARGRRLLQDHQPVGADGACARWATPRRRSRRSRRMRSVTARCGRRRTINHSTLKAKGFTDDVLAKLEASLGTAFDIKFVFNKWTLGEAFLTGTLAIPAEKLNDPSVRAAGASGLLEEAHRGGQRARVRRDDGRRCAASEDRASRRVRLRQSVRTQGQAVSVGGEPHPDAGGVAAVHLGRDLQDDQHGERCQRRGLQEAPTCCRGGSR